MKLGYKIATGIIVVIVTFALLLLYIDWIDHLPAPSCYTTYYWEDVNGNYGYCNVCYEEKGGLFCRCGNTKRQVILYEHTCITK